MIRLSGPASRSIAEALSGSQLQPRRATFRSVRTRSGAHLDDSMLTVFLGPNSYTGEDMCEISCHGNPLIVDRLVGECLTLGARGARPGEFTLRAYLNGRLDLSQAEAVSDLIQSRSEAGLALALGQMHGVLRKKLDPIRDALLDLVAHLAAIVEFSEEDLPGIERDRIRSQLADLQRDLTTLTDRGRDGQILQHGVSLAIVGAPNVGKSSILNQLLGRDRAIVTPVAGTTRDTIEEELSLDGLLFRLIDTAGMAATEDTVEAIGIERSRTAIESADVVLLVLDGSRQVNDEDRQVTAVLSDLMKENAGNTKVLVAVNKRDLPLVANVADLAAGLDPISIVATSATAASGLEELKTEMGRLIRREGSSSEFLVSNERHLQSLRSTNEIVRQAAAATEEMLPLDLVSLDLRAALATLDEIAGEGVGEDVLDRVFSRFCIGK